jgi:hypothetical protein
MARYWIEAGPDNNDKFIFPFHETVGAVSVEEMKLIIAKINSEVLAKNPTMFDRGDDA